MPAMPAMLPLQLIARGRGGRAAVTGPIIQYTLSRGGGVPSSSLRPSSACLRRRWHEAASSASTPLCSSRFTAGGSAPRSAPPRITRSERRHSACARGIDAAPARLGRPPIAPTRRARGAAGGASLGAHNGVYLPCKPGIVSSASRPLTPPAGGRRRAAGPHMLSAGPHLFSAEPRLFSARPTRRPEPANAARTVPSTCCQ
jgi:hypothetical protein